MAKTAVVQAQQRWEYQTLTKRRETTLADELNTLGQAGWELVSITFGKDPKGEMAWTAFVKRPATQPGAQPAAPAPAGEQATTTTPEPEKAEPGAEGSGFDLSGDEFGIRE